jgi:hypothetical protein
MRIRMREHARRHLISESYSSAPYQQRLDTGVADGVVARDVFGDDFEVPGFRGCVIHVVHGTVAVSGQHVLAWTW